MNSLVCISKFVMRDGEMEDKMCKTNKQIIILSVLAFFLLAAFFLGSCRNPLDQAGEIKVDFDTAGGAPVIEPQRVLWGENWSRYLIRH